MRKLLLLFLFITTISNAQAVFDKGIKVTNVKDTTALRVAVQTNSGVINYNNIAGFQKEKGYLSTGLLKNGSLTINGDPTKYSVTAGIGIVTNFADPDNITSSIVRFPAVTGKTPTYLATSNITYVAINASGVIVESALPFTPTQRRSLIILGAVIHSDKTVINLINNISDPSNDTKNRFTDFVNSYGAFNITGNLYSANGDNLILDKTAGLIYKSGSNFETDITDPDRKSQSQQTALTFRYRLSDGTEGTDRIALDPSLYELNGVLTSVPNNKFTITTVTMFQTGTSRMQRDQAYYSTMEDAQAAINTRSFIVESNIALQGITRSYIIMKHNATSLLDPATSKIIEYKREGGVPSGGVAVTDAQILAALGFTPEDRANRQNSLAVDGSGIKYPTVDATNAGLALKRDITNYTFANDISVSGVNIGVGGGNSTGSTVLGASALNSNFSGSFNTVAGWRTMMANYSGSRNAVFGQSGLGNNITGGKNSVLGATAGQVTSIGVNVTDINNSVLVGYNVKPLADNQTNQIIIASDGLGLGSNTTVLGNSSTTQTWLGGKLTVGTPTNNGIDAGQFNGTISALPATLSNQVVVKSQLDLKSNINNPTFTGTVSGIDKTMVGLSNVDNTSDANKPISTATQTALNLKANDNTVVHLAGAETLTGIKTLNETPIINKLVTTNNKGQSYELLKNGAGVVVSKNQVNVWNGSAYVASGNGLFNGSNSGQNNTGSDVGAINGNNSGQNNTGSNIGSITGSNSGQNNTGSSIGAIKGYFSGQNNTGNTLGLISGTSAGQNNIGGTLGAIIGSLSGRYNAGSNNIIGHNSHSAFLTNAAGIKVVADAETDVNITTDIVTITAHGFGANDSYANLNYTTTGTPIGGLTSGTIYKVKIIDANSLFFYINDLTSIGTNTHSFTPQFKYDNVNIYGNNVTPTASNQTIIGNASTTEFIGYGKHLIGTTVNNGIDGLQTPLTISHAAGTTANQGVIKSQLDLKSNISGQIFTGAISATNLSGTNTGDQTNISGNALTATTLQTARNINGVSFNGSSNITIADATKEPSFSKNTAFNKNFGTTTGTVGDGAVVATNTAKISFDSTSSTRLANTSGTNTGDQTLSSLGAAPASGSANYIQNGTSQQTANLNISGSGTFGNSSTVSGSSLVNIGFTVDNQDSSSASSGSVLILNKPSKQWRISNSYQSSANGIFAIRDNTRGINVVELNGVNGAATFASSVTATSFNGGAALTDSPTAPTATAGTNTTQIATTAFVAAAVVSSGVSSGSYSPTPALTANIASASVYSAVYTRIGDIVTGIIGFTVTPTAINTNSIVTIPVPISRSFTATRYIGSGALSDTSTIKVPLVARILDNDNMGILFTPTTTNAYTGSITFTYSVN
jgi:hypothetical protein